MSRALSRNAGILVVVAIRAAVAVAATAISVAFPDATGLLTALKGTHFEQLALVGAARACRCCASFDDG